MLNKRDKRGQEGGPSALGMTLAIILGLAVVAVVIYGFVVGWSNFLPWLSPTNNVDFIKSQCSIACSTGSTYGFCTQPQVLKATDLPGGVKEITGTCKSFVTLKNTADKSYGITDCPSVTCT
jgi:hypothetical protein